MIDMARITEVAFTDLALAMQHAIIAASPPTPPLSPRTAKLRSHILRIERLEQEKSDIAESVREVYAEAKSDGYDTKIMRSIVKLRAMDPDSRDEQDHLLELYRKACGIAR